MAASISFYIKNKFFKKATKLKKQTGIFISHQCMNCIYLMTTSACAAILLPKIKV
jgi:hypothetical protein